MSSRAELDPGRSDNPGSGLSAAPACDLPALPTARWCGSHLRETRWQLELYRLLVDPSHRCPELVSHAISVGAGLREMLAVSYPTQAATAGVRHALLRTGRARSPHCLTAACDCAFSRDFRGPIPSDRVRLTSIFSRGDGVVRWQSALVTYATASRSRAATSV